MTAVSEIVKAAVTAGAELVVDEGRLVAKGPRRLSDELRAELKAQRDEVIAFLRRCACGSEKVILHSAADGRPWCRPCAQAEGTKLLRAEHPDWYLPGGRFARRSAA